MNSSKFFDITSVHCLQFVNVFFWPWYICLKILYFSFGNYKKMVLKKKGQKNEEENDKK